VSFQISSKDSFKVSCKSFSLMSSTDSNSPYSTISMNFSSKAWPNRTVYLFVFVEMNSASSSSDSYCFCSYTYCSSSESSSGISGGILPVWAICLKSFAVKMFDFFGYSILIFSLLILVVKGCYSTFSIASSLEGGRSSLCKLAQLKISYCFSLISIKFNLGVYGLILNASLSCTFVPVKASLFGYSL